MRPGKSQLHYSRLRERILPYSYNPVENILLEWLNKHVITGFFRASFKALLNEKELNISIISYLYEVSSYKNERRRTADALLGTSP